MAGEDKSASADTSSVELEGSMEEAYCARWTRSQFGSIESYMVINARCGRDAEDDLVYARRVGTVFGVAGNMVQKLYVVRFRWQDGRDELRYGRVGRTLLHIVLFMSGAVQVMNKRKIVVGCMSYTSLYSDGIEELEDRYATNSKLRIV
jgi:hypothetical protein